MAKQTSESETTYDEGKGGQKENQDRIPADQEYDRGCADKANSRRIF